MPSATQSSWRQLLFVVNPHSTHFLKIKQQVLDPARHLKGYRIGKYHITKSTPETNIARLASLIQPADLVIALGGDGTANVVANAILQSGQPATFATLPFGNFNDTAHTFQTFQLQSLLQLRTANIYPLEISINQQFWRYAISYLSVGMLAASTNIFNHPQLRQRLQHTPCPLFTSFWALALWYFRYAKSFQLNFQLNQQNITSCTDYLAINGAHTARLLHTPDSTSDPNSFFSFSPNLRHFYQLLPFLAQGFFGNLPLTSTTQDQLTFAAPTTLQLQAEGELCTLSNVSTLTIKKSPIPLSVLRQV